MTTAREEAEKRYPIDVYVLPVRDEQLARANAVRRLAFITGAEWQAGQPLEITDDMVERAARRIEPGAWEGGARSSAVKNVRQTRVCATARAALEAALGGEA